MLGVYVHIPFCERKCIYCAFSSFTNREVEEEKYISKLVDEIETFSKTHKENKFKDIDTIYIGGGTPTTLKNENIKKIFDAIRKNFNISKNAEITIECNPNSSSYEKFLYYKSLGVNRISLGIQSLNDSQLKFIGRLHNKKEALNAVKEAKRAGFDNVSTDLLIGLKDQNTGDLISELNELISLDVKHFSCYMLQIEDGTKLKEIVDENKNLLPSDDECVDMYSEVASFLRSKGYNRYEISNFAIEGYESKHNTKYWIGENYIGFGLSSHSYIDKVRFANAKNFKDYYDGKKQLKEVLTQEQLIEEHIMLGLRCNKGVDIDYLKNLNYNIEENSSFNYLLSKNIINKNENRIFLNPDYYGVNNYIIVKLLPENL